MRQTIGRPGPLPLVGSGQAAPEAHKSPPTAFISQILRTTHPREETSPAAPRGDRRILRHSAVVAVVNCRAKGPKHPNRKWMSAVVCGQPKTDAPVFVWVLAK